jgi:hypothetical protein
VMNIFCICFMFSNCMQRVVAKLFRRYYHLAALLSS